VQSSSWLGTSYLIIRNVCIKLICCHSPQEESTWNYFFIFYFLFFLFLRVYMVIMTLTFLIICNFMTLNMTWTL
jgi:hypothetical protein